MSNVVQENSLRAALPYTVPSRRADGSLYMRNMNTRRVNETSAKALEINRTIWNAATDLLVA